MKSQFFVVMSDPRYSYFPSWNYRPRAVTIQRHWRGYRIRRVAWRRVPYRDRNPYPVYNPASYINWS